MAGCATLLKWDSQWKDHQTQLAESEAHGDYLTAVAEQRWLIDNAFLQAPRSEHSFEAEARRYLHLAKLAAKAGKYKMAVDALKQALISDPTLAPAVRKQLDALPLTPTQRAKLDSEFSWNIAALQPGDDALAPEVEENACWSYRVSEIRVSHQRRVSTPNGMQLQVTYDARPWVYDSEGQRWRADGGWMTDAGTETEWVNGAGQPRYRALATADAHFYTDGKVPP
ncbi:MAG: hypothetical protein ACRDL7_11130, partial [Gaiellaceae bacterium]